MTGDDHDEFCEYHGETMYNTRPCTCDYIARIRRDERAKCIDEVSQVEMEWKGEPLKRESAQHIIERLRGVHDKP